MLIYKGKLYGLITYFYVFYFRPTKTPFMSNLLTQLKDKPKQIQELYDHILFAQSWLTENFESLPENLKCKSLQRLELLYDQFLHLTGAYHHEYVPATTSLSATSPPMPKPRDESAEPTTGTYIDKYGSKTVTLQEALALLKSK